MKHPVATLQGVPHPVDEALEILRGGDTLGPASRRVLADMLAAERRRADAAETDAMRWRWVLEKNPGAIAAIAYSVREACAFGDPAEATDAGRAAPPCPAAALAR